MSLFKGLKSIEGLRFRIVDAKGQVVGRLASQIARVLMGKDKPTFSPWKDDGDVVVVVNAQDVEFTGRKWDRKVYRWHTGYPGGLKQRTAKEQHERKPGEVLRAAVMGMLPKNNLRRSMARKLRIYPGPEHDYQNVDGLDVVNFEMPPRKLREKGSVLVLPPGFEPFNPHAYWKRYGHRLGKTTDAAEQQQQQ
ncbi:putative 50S ribosomal protein L13 [Nannochloris sp. 'desiccata']|nr:putative 50S ribosomal protein L13 [Chlorella desiccata (nom. nud.)]